MIDPLWQLTLTLFFSLLFAGTAWHKWQAIHQTATAIATYRLIPVAWCYPAAYAVAGMESLAVLLLWVTPTIGVVVIIGLLACYAVAIQINLHRGRTNMDCGCGGVPIRLTPWLVVRNVVLIGFASLILLAKSQVHLTWVDLTISILIAVTLLVLYYTGEQLLSNRGQQQVLRT